jgi:hypothetical protein
MLVNAQIVSKEGARHRLIRLHAQLFADHFP